MPKKYVCIVSIQNYVNVKNATKTILIVFVSFGIYHFLDAMYFKLLREWFFVQTNYLGVSHILTYTISGIPLFVGTYVLSRRSGLLENLGLNRSILKGFLFVLLCTLPMFIGFMLLFEYNAISVNSLIIKVIAAGFFEELFFRGFLFGVLFRKTNFGFIPAVLFGAIYFGVLHLYQSTEIVELLGIFLITFLGGILFAWVYVEWNYNLWTAIFLHMLMNLSWELFNVSDNALGGVYSNIFRFATLGLVILLTLVYKKQHGIKMEVNRKNIFKKIS